MKVKVPPILKFGSHTYKVCVSKETWHNGNDGTVEHVSGVISISPQSGPARMRRALIHEALHIIHHVWWTEADLDEGDINRLAEGIAVLFDNLGIELNWKDVPIK